VDGSSKCRGRWFARLALIGLGVAGLAALMPGGRARPDAVVLRLGHSLDTSHPVHRALEHFAEETRVRSGGRLKVRIHPNSQLGSEREMIELTQLGALDLVKTSTSPLEGFSPVMGIFSVPYVFHDDAHFWEFLEGPGGEELLQASLRQRLRGLCYYDAGSRSFYTRARPIREPSDLRGLKIRVQNSRTSMRMVQAMGGAPTPLSFAELYSALEQGVVDGAENNPPSFLTARHYEVCRYYTLDEHTRVPDIVLINTDSWDRLSRDEQQMVAEVARESARLQRSLWAEKTQEALETVEAAGVEIIRPDQEAFARAARPVHDEHAGSPIGDLIRRLRAMRQPGGEPFDSATP
jgi:tripartite ATP-independent transporter DctP family solute receptor